MSRIIEQISPYCRSALTFVDKVIKQISYLGGRLVTWITNQRSFLTQKVNDYWNNHNKEMEISPNKETEISPNKETEILPTRLCYHFSASNQLYCDAIMTYLGKNLSVNDTTASGSKLNILLYRNDTPPTFEDIIQGLNTQRFPSSNLPFPLTSKDRHIAWINYCETPKGILKDKLEQRVIQHETTGNTLSIHQIIYTKNNRHIEIPSENPTNISTINCLKEQRLAM